MLSPRCFLRKNAYHQPRTQLSQMNADASSTASNAWVGVTLGAGTCFFVHWHVRLSGESTNFEVLLCSSRACILAIKMPVPASGTCAFPTTQLPYEKWYILQCYRSLYLLWVAEILHESWSHEKSKELTISPYEIVIDKYFHLSHPAFTLNQQSPEVFQVKIAVFFWW